MPPDLLPITYSPDPSKFDLDMLPNAVADAIARVIAEKDLEIAKMLELVRAESRAINADLRADLAETKLQLAHLVAETGKTVGDALEIIAKENESRAPRGDDDTQHHATERGEKASPGRKANKAKKARKAYPAATD